VLKTTQTGRKSVCLCRRQA